MGSGAETTTPGSVVPPAVPSGIARRKRAIIGGLAFLTAIYGIAYLIVKDSTFFPQPAKKFCPDERPCSRPDLFGFQVCSGIMQVFMGLTGFTAWHVSKRAHSLATPEGRLFGYLDEADVLNAGIFVYQTWDFIFSLLIPEHSSAVFLAHHALAAITAWFSLEHQLVHHYAIFFGGCSEVSSIFLVLCDFDIYFPAARGSLWGGVIMFCQAMFTLAFLYYRVIMWCVVSIRLWSDVLYVRKNKLVEQYRPGKVWSLYLFPVMNVVLGLLQLYWFGFGIVPKVFELINS